MFEKVGIGRRIEENMKDDEEELEMLLGEIPQAIEFNFHHQPHINAGNVHGAHDHGLFRAQRVDGKMCEMCDDETPSAHNNKRTCVSPVSGFSLQSDGSSSSLFSSGHSSSDNGSPPPPPLEELKSHVHSRNFQNLNGSSFDFKLPDESDTNTADLKLIDELYLSRNFCRMYLGEGKDDAAMIESKRYLLSERTHRVNSHFGYDKLSAGILYNIRKDPDHGEYQYCVSRRPENFEGEMGSALPRLLCDQRVANSPSAHYLPPKSDGLFAQSNCSNSPIDSQCQRANGSFNYYCNKGSNLANVSPRPLLAESLYCAQHKGMNVVAEQSAFLPRVSQFASSRPSFNVESMLHYQLLLNQRAALSSNSRNTQGSLDSFTREDSLILESDDLSYGFSKGYGKSKEHDNKVSWREIGMERQSEEKRAQLYGRLQFPGSCANVQKGRMYFPFSMSHKFNTVDQIQGYIYWMAKDQHGCRFLQRIFDEGTAKDVQIVFAEIIDHVAELMINPFGNYLMQKLLEVCNEEQRMHILLRVTKVPGELVRISLNIHGTRVVQKLVGTLRIKQHISLVISALEPGFLALIKDLNGNHVVQRCLQCLCPEDNEFIFVAAAKYCVEIATHQHGCCVLQRCIGYSKGKYREELVAEISANGLLLAQDAFGNYVVQFILEMGIPSATSKLISQFEGNYVHLSTQKFSSHVVEDCLKVLDNEVRARVIHELLSATHFERLLQDPHANYVLQTALRVAEGPLLHSLVDAIESHRALSRNSPYCKRIFSNKLLKR